MFMSWNESSNYNNMQGATIKIINLVVKLFGVETQGQFAIRNLSRVVLRLLSIKW